jgi:D-arginine dehydrogenase
MDCDFLVIGGGIAGASAAFVLARQAGSARVVVIEREDAPGYHATGRSAAVFLETYGASPVRALTRASRSFLENPPAGFADHPLLSPRGVLHIARADQRKSAERLFAECRTLTKELRLIDAGEAMALQPALRPGYAVCAIHEPGAMDIDVHALHYGFLRGFKANGGVIVTAAEARAIEHGDDGWRVETDKTTFHARTIINAAGAWADHIAALAGLAPLGLVPKRRTVITFDPPAHMDPAQWPMTVDADEEFYFKPDAGRILATPCDETPAPPSDVQPEDLDIALGVDRIQKATTLTVTRIAHKWAGLRSFFADKIPVVGPDPHASDFVWLAGQGGFGIMTSPAMGLLAAALASGADVPADLADAGISAAALGPHRLGGVR